MHMRPLVKCVLGNQLVEPFIAHEMIAHAVDLAGTRRARRAGHAELYVVMLLQKRLYDFGLARARGTGDYEQPSTLRHWNHFILP